MIVYKEWWENRSFPKHYYRWDGWFLFGIIPLYLRRHTIR